MCSNLMAEASTRVRTSSRRTTRATRAATVEVVFRRAHPRSPIRETHAARIRSASTATPQRPSRMATLPASAATGLSILHRLRTPRAARAMVTAACAATSVVAATTKRARASAYSRATPGRCGHAKHNSHRARGHVLALVGHARQRINAKRSSKATGRSSASTRAAPRPTVVEVPGTSVVRLRCRRLVEDGPSR